MQDWTQVGDRILVASGEQAGSIGRVEAIQDHITDVVAESAENSALVIHVALHDLIPHFLPGDNVKNHWSDSFSMVITIDHKGQKVTFLDREASAEVCSFPSSISPD
jgi:transcription elongation factor